MFRDCVRGMYGSVCLCKNPVRPVRFDCGFLIPRSSEVYNRIRISLWAGMIRVQDRNYYCLLSEGELQFDAESSSRVSLAAICSHSLCIINIIGNFSSGLGALSSLVS